MTRSDQAGELLFDPKIEKTTRGLKKDAKLKQVICSMSRTAEKEH